MTNSHNSDERRVSRRAVITTTAATAAAATVPAGVAAQSDDEDRSPLEQALMVLAGIQGEIDSQYERAVGDRADAETAATNAKDEFNDHSDEWVGYINEHASLSGDIQVIALEFVPNPEDKPDDMHMDYLVTEYGDEQYTSATITDATDRTVDEEVRLESIAAENAAEEIEYAYEEFVSGGEPPSERHLAYLAGKYRYGSQHVTTTILGDDLGGDSA